MTNEKITELLNLTGTFFHDYCAAVLKALPLGIAVRTEEPFTYPGSNGPLLGKSGSMDIFAVYSDEKKSFCFSIECKRAMPTTKNWIFFRSREPEIRTFFPYYYSPRHEAIECGGLLFPRLGYPSPADFELCDRIYEIDETLGKINKNQAERAYRSLLQANHGLVAALETKRAVLSEMSHHRNQPMYFVPTVITTANLLLADFDPRKVSPNRGEIPARDINYLERKWVEFEFGLPDYLTRPQSDRFRRRSTFVVNSSSIAEFFEGIVSPDGF